jgi:hypothetical protein
MIAKGRGVCISLVDVKLQRPNAEHCFPLAFAVRLPEDILIEAQNLGEHIGFGYD